MDPTPQIYFSHKVLRSAGSTFPQSFKICWIYFSHKILSSLALMASPSILSAVSRRLEGKVALITGGASGIGECTAKLFAKHGARVVVADIQDDKGHALCDQIGRSIASYVHCDVTDESNVRDAVDMVISLHGKLDIMLNNAGIFGSPVIRIVESEKSNFEKVMAVNTTGSYLGTKHAARVMAPAGQGSIIITASVASVNPGTSPVAYACSKHALIGLMGSAAAELGQFGVRVNCVSPYRVATPSLMKALGMEKEELEKMVEEKAVLKGATLTAEDVAEAVLYLASDESKYVSGLNLFVDGAFRFASPTF